MNYLVLAEAYLERMESKAKAELLKIAKTEEAMKEYLAKKLERAASYFEGYKANNVFHVTSDGQAFQHDHAASAHGRTMKDKTVLPVKRSDLTETVKESEGDEESEEDTAPVITADQGDAPAGDGKKKK